MRDITRNPTQPADDLELESPPAGKVARTERVYRRADGAATPDRGAPDAIAMAHASTGLALPEGPRTRMESSLGTDLSDVRVHTGAESQAAAVQLKAQAFTTGNDIHFGAGQYRPEDPYGVHLLAHEVAHTVQQRGGESGLQTKLEVSEPGDAAEVAADQFADHVVHGAPAPTLSAAPSSAVQRKPAASDSEDTAVEGFKRGDDDAGQTYAHGAFMGAAGQMMKDPTWTAIFAAVWKDEYDRVSKIKDLHSLMLALENNPVLSAYGECKSLEQRGGAEHAADPKKTKVVPQEWDIWLDPKDPADLSKCKIAHGTKGTTVYQALRKDSPVGYAAKDVKAAKNAGQWMEIYGKAIAMYRGAGQVANEGGNQQEARQQAMAKALEATTAQQAIDIAVDFMRAENGGGVVLDVKSTYSKPEDINAFIGTLKGMGVNVIGVGTFRHDQLVGLEEGVRPVKFYHGLQGLQNAADKKELKSGDHVMFNGGSLVDKSGGWIRDVSYGVDQSALQELTTLVKAHNLYVALYVQETDIDPAAVDVLIKLVNRYPGVFREGFAYGNINKHAEKASSGTGMGAQSTPDAWDKLNQKVF